MEAESFVAGFEGALGGLLAGVMSAGRQAAADNRAAEVARVALANRRTAIASRARARVLATTVQGLREELEVAYDDLDFSKTEAGRLRVENARLMAALAAVTQRAA